MLMPKRVKYRKTHRGRMKGYAKGGTTLSFGTFGLQALEPIWLNSNQIEAARIALTKFTKKGGVCLKVFSEPQEYGINLVIEDKSSVENISK